MLQCANNEKRMLKRQQTNLFFFINQRIS